MEQLKKWIEENMVRVSYGDYEGLNDLDLAGLESLKAFVETARVMALAEQLKEMDKAV